MIITKKDEKEKTADKSKSKIIKVQPPVTSRRAFLEIGPPTDILELLRVTEDTSAAKRGQRNVARNEDRTEEDFEDNPDVPPLE